jgi:hypothetical protein
VETIKRAGAYERTLVAVSADHGESLFDDGILGHGIRVTDSQLHALLLANRPLPAFSGVLAQSDLAVELLKGIGATVDGARRHSPVLELIGDPAMPAELGYMDGGQDYFVLNNLTGEIKADWLSRPMPVETIAPGSREQKTLLKLVADWKNQVRH